MHCHVYLNRLRQRGYRITPQREMIIETLAYHEEHITADVLFAQVRQRSAAINLATVYRTLDMLVDEGLANRVNLHDGQSVYTTSQHGLHVHLVCRYCGEVINADHNLLNPLLEKLKAQYGFTADLQHVSILGVCAHCQEDLGRQEV